MLDSYHTKVIELAGISSTKTAVDNLLLVHLSIVPSGAAIEVKESQKHRKLSSARVIRQRCHISEDETHWESISEI